MSKTINIVAAIVPAAIAIAPAHASDGFWKRSYQPDQPISKIQDAAERFDSFDTAARGDSTAIPNYVRSGIVLSDLACEQWLDTLGRADRDAGFAKDVLNIVGNLILGIAGINGANPGHLARGSLGLAAGNASIDAFKNEVILGAISDIEAKLTEGRKITAATIKTYLPTTTNYDDAKGLLVSYHRDCSPNAIKQLLKTSLSAVKYKEADTTLSGAIASAKADALAGELSADIYPGPQGRKLNDNELYQLYLTKIMKVGDVAFLDSMTAPESKAIASDFSANNEAERLAKLRDIAALKDFGARYKADKAIAQARADAEKEQARVQTTVAASAVVNARKSLPAADAAKVADTPELKQFFALPKAERVTPTVLEQLLQRSKAITEKRGTTSAKALAEATEKLAQSKLEQDEAQKKVAEVAGTPDPKPIAPDAVRSLAPPVSVNAVLVPVARDK